MLSPEQMGHLSSDPRATAVRALLDQHQRLQSAVRAWWWGDPGSDEERKALREMLALAGVPKHQQ